MSQIRDTHLQTRVVRVKFCDTRLVSVILGTQAPVKIQRLLQDFLRSFGVKELELYNLLRKVKGILK